MKKVLLVLGLVLALAALAGGLAVAYADDNGNGGSQSSQVCDSWLMGTIMGKTGTAEAGTITVLPKGESATVNISVNGSTLYRAWMAQWQDVDFGDLNYGDWIAICLDGNTAKVVVLLEAPYRLHLEGNVTAVNGSVVTVHTAQGGNFTINLSNAGVDISGIQAGQPVTLTIGKQAPLFGRFFPGLRMGRIMGMGQRGLGTWMEKHEAQIEKLQQRFEQKLEKWQERHGN
jgi:hypothetical protein